MKRGTVHHVKGKLEGRSEFARLTQAEKEVFDLAVRGMRAQDMAELRFVCEKTIKYHLTNVYKKLGVKSKSELIAFELEKEKEAALEKERQIAYEREQQEILTREGIGPLPRGA